MAIHLVARGIIEGIQRVRSYLCSEFPCHLQWNPSPSQGPYQIASAAYTLLFTMPPGPFFFLFFWLQVLSWEICLSIVKFYCLGHLPQSVTWHEAPLTQTFHLSSFICSLSTFATCHYTLNSSVFCSMSSGYCKILIVLFLNALQLKAWLGTWRMLRS